MGISNDNTYYIMKRCNPSHICFLPERPHNITNTNGITHMDSTVPGSVNTRSKLTNIQEGIICWQDKLMHYTTRTTNQFLGWVVVFNATFNNISVISGRSVLLVEETVGPGKTTVLSQVTDTLCIQYISARVESTALVVKH